MKSPSDYEKRIVAMVDSFTKTVARNFSRNLKRAKAGPEFQQKSQTGKGQRGEALLRRAGRLSS